MFCNQCEETARGCACTIRGVCGKDAETAGVQDVLIWVLRGLAARNVAATAAGGGLLTSACSSRGPSSARSRTSTSTPTAFAT